MVDYDAIAEDAIIRLLNREHAAVWLEIEAKLAERPYVTPTINLSKGINPHHLTNARRRLTDRGVIEERESITRGGRAIGVMGFADRHKRETAYARAARRKRLLHARYRGWAEPPSGTISMIGEAGERVAHASLVAAAQALDPTRASYLLSNRATGRVSTLLGKPVSGGPLDDAAHLLLPDGQGGVAYLTLPIEVKNVRHWMYPSAWEIYQLLDKAARLAVEHPSHRFVPVLVCRRAHYTTFLMAQDLGFLVFETIVQPILPHSDVKEAALNEVRDELGYGLEQTDEAIPLLTQAFRERVPEYAIRTANRWAATAPELAPFYSRLRRTSLTGHYREAELTAMKQVAAGLPGVRGIWIKRPT